MAAAERSSPETLETPLVRAISSRMLLFFVIGDVLGAGIYALVGEVGGRVGGAIWAFIYATVWSAGLAAWRQLYLRSPFAATVVLGTLVIALAGYVTWQIRRRPGVGAGHRVPPRHELDLQ